MSEMVFAEVRPGRLRRMPREDAEANGYRIDGKSRLGEFKQRAVLMTALDKVRGVHGTRGVGGAKVHLSAAERKSIERLTGIPVMDAQDARRAIKMKGMRFLEKGEELDETLKKQAAGESVPFPGWDRLGVMEKPKEFNFEERLARNRQRFGEN